MEDYSITKAQPVADPLSLIGMGVLGAFAHWCFNKLIKVPRPRGPGGRDALAALRADVQTIRSELSSVQGELGGIGERLGRLEGLLKAWRSGGNFGD